MGRMVIDAMRLRRLREDRVLSQRELAREAGLAYGTIWRLENGYPNARPATVRAVAKALGVTPRELLMRREANAQCEY